MDNTDRNESLKEKDSSDLLILEVHDKVAAAFDIFDHENNKSVDVREVGTIIRSLGCCPSEAELHDILTEMEKPEPTGNVSLEDFLPLMTRVLLEKRYKPRHEDELLKAFQAMDVEDQGFLTEEQLKKYLMEEGEVFNQEEMDEMLSAAIDTDTGQINYRSFVSNLVVED